MEKLPGATTSNIEFYSNNGKDLYMVSGGRIIPFEDFYLNTLNLLRDELEGDMEASNCLNSILDPEDQLKRFTICRYGALNQNPDYNSGVEKFQDIEYFDCGVRGMCPYRGEGKVCHEIVVGDEVVTRQEIRVIKLIAEDLTDREIADRLFISVHTATTHRQNITRKLGFKKAGLARWAVERQIV